jgi:hypothetical protein
MIDYSRGQFSEMPQERLALSLNLEPRPEPHRPESQRRRTPTERRVHHQEGRL